MGEQSWPHCSVVEIVAEIQEWIERVQPIIQEHLHATQEEQWCMYYQPVQPQTSMGFIPFEESGPPAGTATRAHRT